MNIYLLVIDGLGMWHVNHASTYRILTQGCDIDSKICFPNLYELGIEKAANGSANLMHQLSIGVGSLEGHREMLGHVSSQEYYVLEKAVPTDILKKVADAFNTGFIGNIQCRGQTALPTFWKQHLSSGQPIIYTGYDSTIIIACEEKVIPKEKLVSIATALQQELYCRNLCLRKVIIRQYKGTFHNLSTETEIFAPVSFTDVCSPSIQHIVINRKIDAMIQIDGATVIDCSNDAECFAYLYEHRTDNNTLFFLNLGDFDRFAHQGDLHRCKTVLSTIDTKIGVLISLMNEDDALIIVSDHGVSFQGSSLSSAHLNEDTLLLLSRKETHFVYRGIHLGYGIVNDLLHTRFFDNELARLGFSVV